MGKLTDAVERWALKEAKLDSFVLSVTPDGNRATIGFLRPSTRDFNYLGCIEVTEDQQLVELSLDAPVNTPEGRRPAVSDAIARARKVTALSGRIELDMDDGAIGFRGAIETEGRRLSTKSLTRLLENGYAMLDRYLPAFTDVARRDVSPADAIAEANREAPPPLDSATAPAWDLFPGTGRVQSWARELKAACATSRNASSAWELAARAVVLVGDDMRTCRTVAHRAAVDAGMQFVAVNEDDVMSLPSPAAFRRIAPVMVFLQPGRWMLASEDGESPEAAELVKQFQRRLAEWVREFEEAQPVLYVTSACTIQDVVESLRYVGLFDRFLNVPTPTMLVWGNRTIDIIGREHCGVTITQSPAKVGKLFRNAYDEERREDLVFLRIRRLLASQTRPLEFLDLVNLETHGFVEADVPPAESAELRKTVAYHEAGHAAVAVIDSRGGNVPDCASIIPSATFEGVVVESYEYHSNLGDRVTYESMRHRVRIRLAGRAAEELFVGPAQVSNGASSDLETATDHATDAFALWGFAPDMDEAGKSASNLAVRLGKATPSSDAHVEGLVRGFLATQYGVVLAMLERHRSFVDAIAERLLIDPMLDQGTLMELAGVHVAKTSLVASAVR